jgi:hypothetical protein
LPGLVVLGSVVSLSDAIVRAMGGERAPGEEATAWAKR